MYSFLDSNTSDTGRRSHFISYHHSTILALTGLTACINQLPYIGYIFLYFIVIFYLVDINQFSIHHIRRSQAASIVVFDNINISYNHACVSVSSCQYPAHRSQSSQPSNSKNNLHPFLSIAKGNASIISESR